MIKALPVPVLVILCLTLGLAPFVPEPHLLEKLRMLINGRLTEPVDIFDLLLHGLPFILLIAALIGRLITSERKNSS